MSGEEDRRLAQSDKAVKSSMESLKLDKNMKDQLKSDKIDDCQTQRSPSRFARSVAFYLCYIIIVDWT